MRAPDKCTNGCTARMLHHVLFDDGGDGWFCDDCLEPIPEDEQVRDLEELYGRSVTQEGPA